MLWLLFRYTSIAQELAAAARGECVDGNKWKIRRRGSEPTSTYEGQASMDDITVFVIPIKYASNLPRDEDNDDDDELLVI